MRDSGAEASGTAGESLLPRVMVFFDYTCPFCYVDQSRLDRLAAEREFEMILVPFELRPEMPDAGIPESELEATGASEKVHEHLLRVAEQEGIPFVLPPFLPKTHLALTLAELARDRGHELHAVMHRAIFDAHFGRGLDIGSREVLMPIALEHGLVPEDVTAAWDDDVYAERLHQFRHVALNLGIDATPAAVICNELIIGSRPYEVLRDALDRCLVTRDSVRQEGAEP